MELLTRSNAVSRTVNSWLIFLIKIRTFLKKIDSYLEKYKFERRFEGLRLAQISPISISPNFC